MHNMILLVEDNQVNQKLILLFLKKLGYQAETVSNGREAVKASSSNQYALILMDCDMPEMDGFEATIAIRHHEQGTGRHIPIIALTASVMKGDKEKCFAAGMDDFLGKPMNLQDLRAMIERWMPFTPLTGNETTAP